DSFVTCGGRVLADVPPATHDLWGNAHIGSPAAAWFANPAADGEQPHSLLLGQPFVTALNDADAARGLRAWLADAGVHPVDEAGRRNSIDFEGERFAYTFGKARVFAYSLPPHSNKNSARFRIGFDKNAFAYELVDGEALLSGNWAVVRVTREQPALFSVLPYEVSRLVVSAPESMAPGQRLTFDVVVKSKGDLPGTHMVHARLRAGLDFTLPQYDQVIECPNGQGAGYIALAYNEIPGAYTLELHDVLSGARTTHEFTILGTGI
ncbi:MAG: hypothetical protein WD873_08365, partial [Candidatus Hydrogenedentales bacterium]